MEFSDEWKSYYDFGCAGQETIKKYADDCNSHRAQVKNFIEGFSEEELLEISNQVDASNSFQLTNHILTEIGYKFKEQPQNIKG